MREVRYNGQVAALIIDGTWHYKFPDATDWKSKLDQAEEIFTELPKPNGRVFDMNSRERALISFVDTGITDEDL